MRVRPRHCRLCGCPVLDVQGRVDFFIRWGGISAGVQSNLGHPDHPHVVAQGTLSQADAFGVEKARQGSPGQPPRPLFGNDAANFYDLGNRGGGLVWPHGDGPRLESFDQRWPASHWKIPIEEHEAIAAGIIAEMERIQSKKTLKPLKSKLLSIFTIRP